MVDDAEDRKYKLALMSDEEKKMAFNLWNAETDHSSALAVISEHYWPLIRACKTQAQALKIISRVPDCEARKAFTQYAFTFRDWSKPDGERK